MCLLLQRGDWVIGKSCSGLAPSALGATKFISMSTSIMAVSSERYQWRQCSRCERRTIHKHLQVGQKCGTWPWTSPTPYSSGTRFPAAVLISHQYRHLSRRLLQRLPHMQEYLKAILVKDGEIGTWPQKHFAATKCKPLRPSSQLRTWLCMTPNLQFLFSNFLVFFSAKKLRWRSKRMGVGEKDGSPFLEQFSNENCE